MDPSKYFEYMVAQDDEFISEHFPSRFTVLSHQGWRKESWKCHMEERNNSLEAEVLNSVSGAAF